MTINIIPKLQEISLLSLAEEEAGLQSNEKVAQITRPLLDELRELPLSRAMRDDIATELNSESRSVARYQTIVNRAFIEMKGILAKINPRAAEGFERDPYAVTPTGLKSMQHAIDFGALSDAELNKALTNAASEGHVSLLIALARSPAASRIDPQAFLLAFTYASGNGSPASTLEALSKFPIANSLPWQTIGACLLVLADQGDDEAIQHLLSFPHGKDIPRSKIEMCARYAERHGNVSTSAEILRAAQEIMVME